MCAIKYTARQRIKAVSYKLQLEHWKKEQHVQIAVTHYDKKNKLMTIFKIYFLWNKNDEKWLFLSRFQHLRIATVCARVGGKMLWRWSASNKTERDTTLASSLQMTLPPQLRPLNASSLESTAALVASWSTPNLWPLTPGTTEFITEASAQFAQRGAHPVSGRDDDRREQQWVQVYRCSLNRLLFFLFLPLYLLHIVHNHTKSSTQSFRLWICGCGCFHVTVGPICPDATGLEKKILLFLDGKLPATERSGYKSAALSSLLKKHVPAQCTYIEKM